MHRRFDRMTRRGLLANLALLGTALLLQLPAQGGELFHRNSGAALDPGISPHHGPYDASIPGVRPPSCGHRDHARHVGAHRYPNRVTTGLFRYPCFGGYIPASPYRDCLYPSGPHPWQR